MTGTGSSLATIEVLGETTAPVVEEVFAEVLDAEDAEQQDIGPRGRHLTPEECQRKQEVLLATYNQTGRLDVACKRAGVSFKTHRRWLYTDPHYAERFAMGADALIAKAESRVVQLAFSDQKIPNGMALSACMALLNANAPEKYRPRGTVDVNHRIIPDYAGMKRA